VPSAHYHEPAGASQPRCVRCRQRESSPANAELLGKWLDAHLLTFKEMERTLSHYIPNILTLPVPFSASASENHVAATLTDIERLLTMDVSKTPSMSEAIRGAVASKLSTSMMVSQFNNRLKRRTKGAKPTRREAAASIGSTWRAQVVLKQFRGMQWACTIISSRWRAFAARKVARKKRMLRDATVLLYYHMRRWIKRRRARSGLDQDDLSVKVMAAKMVEKDLAKRRLLRRQQTAAF